MKRITAASGLHGSICVPGDKSISHRSVMLGAIAEGNTYVRGFLKSADCLATIDCFRRMGIDIEELPADPKIFQGAEAGETMLVIRGKGLRGLRPVRRAGMPDGEVFLDAMNSGTTTRLISGILAGQDFTSHITGDDSLKKRPMNRIIRPLGEMGIKATSEHGDGRLPLTIHGGKPHATVYESPVASAQVKSCVLLAGLYCDEPVTLIEPSLSRNHTELMLESFGAKLTQNILKDESITSGKDNPENGDRPENDGKDDQCAYAQGQIGEAGKAETTIYPGNILRGQRIQVPGDISSAAYFLVAGLIVPESEVTCLHVGINRTRDGILRVIRAMGGSLELKNIHREGQEPVADLVVRSSHLHGTEIGGALIPALIDELPVIAVMAACAEGDTVIKDAAELKVKETNRLAEIVKDLTIMGVSVEETQDGMVIHGAGEAVSGETAFQSRGAMLPLKGAEIDPRGDHRMAMAFSVAALAAEGTTTILDEECVSVSYPSFYSDLESLRIV